MEANLRSATQELSPEEEACLAQIRTLFATRTPIRWEGVELGRYWMELGKKLQMDRLYRAAAK